MYHQPRGAVLSFGEHKGYALAFVCEMLAGALCGSGTMRPERQDRGTATNGMLTIVIDPGRLVDRAWLREEIAAMTAYIIASPPRHPDEPVRPRTPDARGAHRQRRANRRRDLARSHRRRPRHQCAGRAASLADNHFFYRT
jgi:uncharacterized oxidoreductase